MNQKPGKSDPLFYFITKLLINKWHVHEYLNKMRKLRRRRQRDHCARSGALPECQVAGNYWRAGACCRHCAEDGAGSSVAGDDDGGTAGLADAVSGRTGAS